MQIRNTCRVGDVLLAEEFLAGLLHLHDDTVASLCTRAIHLCQPPDLMIPNHRANETRPMP